MSFTDEEVRAVEIVTANPQLLAALQFGTQEFTRVRQACASDPELLKEFLLGMTLPVTEELPKPRRDPVACPDVMSLTALQGSFYANEKVTNPYKVTLETWIIGGDDLDTKEPQWRETVQLYDHKEFRRLITYWEKCERKGKPVLSTRFLDTLKVMQADLSFTHVGLISSRAKGMTYFEDQLVFADIMNGEPSRFMLLTGTNYLIAKEFSDSYATGKPLSKATAQLRIDLCGMERKKWATDKADVGSLTE